MAQKYSKTLGGYTRLPASSVDPANLWEYEIGTKKLPRIPATLKVFIFKVEDLLTTHYFSPGHFLIAGQSYHFLGRTAPKVQDLVNSSIFTPDVQVQRRLFFLIRIAYIVFVRKVSFLFINHLLLILLLDSE